MRIWGAPVLRDLGQSTPDCSKCRRPEHVKSREVWGCDAPAEQPVFEIGCSSCDGGDPECDACDGSGAVWIYQCPTSYIRRHAPVGQAVAWLDSVVRAYIQYDSRNVLPAAGGYADQSASFGRCVDLIDSERGRYEEMRAAKQRREQKLAKMKQQGGSAPKGRRR